MSAEPTPMSCQSHASDEGTNTATTRENNRTAKARRGSRKHGRIEPYAWLAAGAVGVGIAAAALAGSGVVHASETAADGASSASSSETSSTADRDDTGAGQAANESSSASAGDTDSAANDGGGSSDDDLGSAGSDDDFASTESEDSDDEGSIDTATTDADVDADTGGTATGVHTTMLSSTDTDTDTDTEADSVSSDAEAAEPAPDTSPTVSLGSPTTNAAPTVTPAAAKTTSAAAASSAPAPTITVIPVNSAAPVALTAAPQPAAPTSPLAAFFRKLQSTWSNVRPTANPWVDPGQSPLGVVTGNVGAFDADGDALTVALSNNPTRGYVTLNSDGSFTYTPTRMLAEAGGSDTFTVVVRESGTGFHMHGMASLWTSRTVTCAASQAITVTISAIDTGAGPGPSVIIDSQQRGFTLPTWQSDGYDHPDLVQAFREMKEMGATWVELTPTWYQQDRYSSEIAPMANTVSDAGVERAIELAHQEGLKVFLKPHLDLPTARVRNTINPTDKAGWFSSFTSFISHYATMAQHMNVEQFSLATELSLMTNQRQPWLDVIQAVRERYSGTLVYSAGTNWRTIPFWDAVDVIGIDVYTPLSSTPTTDVQALQNTWETFLDEGTALALQYGKQILFTEAGFTSLRGTTTDPANWTISNIPDQTEQAAGYQSLLATFMGQPWFAGVHWWMWENNPTATDFSPKGKEAEQVLRQWWT